MCEAFFDPNNGFMTGSLSTRRTRLKFANKDLMVRSDEWAWSVVRPYHRSKEVPNCLVKVLTKDLTENLTKDLGLRALRWVRPFGFKSKLVVRHNEFTDPETGFLLPAQLSVNNAAEFWRNGKLRTKSEWIRSPWGSFAVY